MKKIMAVFGTGVLVACMALAADKNADKNKREHARATDEGKSKKIQSEEAERLAEAGEILMELVKAPDESIPSDLLQRAECVAVIPSLKKFALGVGGRFGRGAVSCRTGGAEKLGAWGPPSMITVGGGSFGFQIGGQAADVVMLVMNKKGMDHLLKSEFTLGGDASAAAGPKGREASASTDATMGAEILTYSRAKGLFAGVSLQGSVVKPDDKANERIYGRTVSPKELLQEAKYQIPAAAQPFIDALNKVAPARSGTATSTSKP